MLSGGGGWDSNPRCPSRGTTAFEFAIVGCGTVFKLVPPASAGAGWTKVPLHAFTGADGGLPGGRLWLDASGAIYGTTYQGGPGPCTNYPLDDVIGCGVVFKLTPPAAGHTAWTYKILHGFKGPDGAGSQGGVIADNAGRLYGTAAGGGANGNGVAFRLNPPAAGQTIWRYTILHSFKLATSGDNPAVGFVADPDGRLYTGVNSGGSGFRGTIVRITP